MICILKDKVAYCPGEEPVDGKCTVCSMEMARFVLSVSGIWVNLTKRVFNHINEKHLIGKGNVEPLQCPYSRCEKRLYCGTLGLRRHCFNARSIEEPLNCVSQKGKWIADLDVGERSLKGVC